MIKSRRSPDQPVRLGLKWDRNLNSGEPVTCSGLEFYSERVDSGNHPGWFTQDDGGGFFDLQRTQYSLHPSPSVRVSAIAGGGDPFLSYQGSFVTSLPSGTMPLGDGASWGATAYARMRPDKPPYSLLNMVYELKDLGQMFRSLQSFWSLEQFKRPGGILKEGSSRFLGQLFGWNPLINDIVAVCESYQKMKERIEWLIRNEGKWVKRRIELTNSQTLTIGDWVSSYDALSPILTSQHYIDVPSYRDSRFVKDKTWAVAEFKYFLPPVPPGANLKKILSRTYLGVRAPTFADIYRAVPWSWLIDWCFNYATILENMGPGLAERLAARRYYIMREQEVVNIRHARGKFRGFGGAPDVPVEASAWRSDLHKTRAVGLPFYPGNPNNLSGMQLAIMGALGLSRL